MEESYPVNHPELGPFSTSLDASNVSRRRLVSLWREIFGFWTQMLSRPKATPLSYLHLANLTYSLSSVDTIILNISIAGVWTLSAVLHSDRPGK